MKVVALLWPKIAAQPQPIPQARAVMLGGYGAAESARELARVQELWDAVEISDMEVKLARAKVVRFFQRMAAAIMACGHSARG